MEGGEARIVAYTKVFAIRARLDKRVRYITDGEKTSLASSITYISNPEKTEQFFFTSVLNCSSVDTALSEMMETKQQFGKMGGVLGYHFIQSFQPGEVTPEQAHAVGLEFAKRLFGKRYEVVRGNLCIPSARARHVQTGAPAVPMWSAPALPARSHP